MDRVLERRLRYYLRLNYPINVIAVDAGFCGWFPDLPDCRTEADDVRGLYIKLDVLRVAYLTRLCSDGQEPPLPNAHLNRSGTAAA